MQNEIEIGDNKPGTVGNCYIGAIAVKAMYDKELQLTLDNIRATQEDGYNVNNAWVYEIRNGSFVLVASAATKEQAQAHMTADRVLVYGREISKNKHQSIIDAYIDKPCTLYTLQGQFPATISLSNTGKARITSEHGQHSILVNWEMVKYKMEENNGLFYAC